MHTPTVAVRLTESGWDVTAVAAEPLLKGSSDVELLEFCNSQGRALVTENVGDFSLLVIEWASETRNYPGLIFTNPKRFNRASLAYPNNLIAALDVFLAAPPIKGNCWIWWLTGIGE